MPLPISSPPRMSLKSIWKITGAWQPPTVQVWGLGFFFRGGKEGRHQGRSRGFKKPP